MKENDKHKPPKGYSLGGVEGEWDDVRQHK